MIATLVEGGLLLRMVVIGLVAGVGVTAVYGTAMFGILRASELRRSRRPRAAWGAATLGATAALAFAIAIAYGVFLLVAG